MSKEVSAKFRSGIRDTLEDSPYSLTMLHNECVANGYSGLFEFMKTERSISVDNKAIVQKAMRKLGRLKK